MTKLSRIIKPWFWWFLLTLSLAAIYLLTVFQVFTGEHTKIVIQQITGTTEYNAYFMNAIVRKSAHMLTFGLLGVLFYRVIRRRSIDYAWFCATLIAALDEWHQSFVPGRTPLLQDVVLDSFAAFLFLTIFANWRRQ
jgi:VanZ family protein